MANAEALAALRSSLKSGEAIIVSEDHTIETRILKSTAGAEAIDLSKSPLRALTPAGLGSIPDPASELTYIDGNPKDSDIAKLMYLGVPIAEIAASGISHERMAASYIESAMAIDDIERSTKVRNDSSKAAVAARQEITRLEAERGTTTDLEALEAKIQKQTTKATTAESRAEVAAERLSNPRYTKGIIDSAKAEKYKAQIGAETILDEKTQNSLRAVLASFDPSEDTMDMLSALTSRLNSCDKLPLNTPGERRHAAIRATAVMPVLVGMINSHISGKDFTFPQAGDFGPHNENFNYAQNFCKMLGLATDPETVKGMNLFLLLHLDHEMNASTTAVKGTMSADNFMWAALTSGVNTLHGKRHGGANFDVLQNLDRLNVLTIDEISASSPEELFKFPQAEVDRRKASQPPTTPEEAQAKVAAYLDVYDAYRDENRGDPNLYLIPGIGHRVYKKLDPRADVIKAQYEVITQGQSISDPLFILAKQLEAQTKERGYGDKGLFPNVDFYSGLTARYTGIDARIMTPNFAVGRTPGWASQGLEHSSRAINRPFQLYTGNVSREAAGEVLSAEAKAANQTVAEFRQAWTARLHEELGEPDPTKITDVALVRALLQRQQDVAAAAQRS